MVEKNQKKVLSDAIKAFGHMLQRLIAIEEMAELTKELIKYERNYPMEDNTDRIAQEIADVAIMLEQLMLLFNNEELVNFYIKFKIDRLKERINGKT